MGVQVSAEFEHPQERMTIASLRGALDELEAVAGVPDDARLKVTTYWEGGWEITASWTPDTTPTPPAPVDPPPYLKDPEPVGVAPVEIHPCYRCQLPIVADGAKKTGYRHQDEGDAGNHYTHAAIRYRPGRDSPQA